MNTFYRDPLDERKDRIEDKMTNEANQRLKLERDFKSMSLAFENCMARLEVFEKEKQLSDKQYEILTKLMNDVHIDRWFSHVTIRKAGGGENGYFHFDAHSLDNLIAVKAYIEKAIAARRSTEVF